MSSEEFLKGANNNYRYMRANTIHSTILQYTCTNELDHIEVRNISNCLYMSNKPSVNNIQLFGFWLKTRFIGFLFIKRTLNI